MIAKQHCNKNDLEYSRHALNVLSGMLEIAEIDLYEEISTQMYKIMEKEKAIPHKDEKQQDVQKESVRYYLVKKKIKKISKLISLIK
jgi:hypothetical protein